MGYLFSFEGIEGSGKTTQVRLAHAFLSAQGLDVLVTREPGGTALGEKVRDLLLSIQCGAIEPLAELFLYEASRVHIVRQVIRPALERGAIVLCDRFTDATVAYQGYGRSINLDLISLLNEVTTAGLWPDTTFLLDCPVGVGICRIQERSQRLPTRGLDRLEQEAIEFHERVRQGYLALADKERERIVVLDACQDIRAVHDTIKECIIRKLRNGGVV